MSRRDLIIYVLIALLAIGGGAVVSALTAAPSALTPILLWIGFSALFLSGIGLLVMLLTAPATPLAPQRFSEAAPQLPALTSEQLHHLLYALMLFGFILASNIVIQLFIHMNPTPAHPISAAVAHLSPVSAAH